MVNALGSFLLGFLFVYLLERSAVSGLVRLAITVGFLGAFTTFSAFSYESLHLMREGAFGLAAANVLGQVVICLFLTWMGVQLARTRQEGCGERWPSVPSHKAAVAAT